LNDADAELALIWNPQGNHWLLVKFYKF